MSGVPEGSVRSHGAEATSDCEPSQVSASTLEHVLHH